MTKIEDIVFYYTGYEEIYHLDNGFTGKIITGEDNSFEGLATNYDHDKMFYLFGKKKKNAKMELYCSTLNDKEMPRVLKADKDGLRYYGDIYLKSRFA